jgi:hypothetical protein
MLFSFDFCRLITIDIAKPGGAGNRRGCAISGPAILIWGNTRVLDNA